MDHVGPPIDDTSENSLGLMPAILDAVADGVTVQDRTGRLVYANATALAMIGFPTLHALLAASPGDVLGRFELLDEHEQPLSPALLPGRLVLEGRPTGSVIVGYRTAAEGLRWADVRAAPLVGADGEVTHAINTFRDVTDRVRAEAALRASERNYRQLVEAMPQVAWTTDASGRLTLVNDRWREYRGVGRGEEAAAAEGVHPDDEPEMARRWQESLASGQPLEAAARLERHDGAYRWHLVRAVPSRGSDGEIRAWIGTSTDIEDERRTQAAVALLAEAAERLDESLDPADTAEAAAAIAVPSLADWCIIELLEADGSLCREAVAGVNADADLVARIKANAADPAGPAPVARAIREGRTNVTDVSDAFVTQVARNAEHRATIGALGAKVIMAVPLIARGRTLGAMMLVATRPDRRYGGTEVQLAENLAHRVALALSNADLYAAEQVARETAEASAARTDALQSITRELTVASTRADVADIATRTAAAALGAATAVLYVPAEAGTLELAGYAGYLPAHVDPFRTLAVDDPLPATQAFRERVPAWIDDAASVGRDDRLATMPNRAPPASLCAVPLLVEDRVIGVFGLTFAAPQRFDRAQRDAIVAHANIVSQALDRVALTEARERLLSDLEAQRNRLETVLRQMPAGVSIADASGALVLSNGQAAEIWHRPTGAADARDDHREVGFTPDGRALEPDDWPLARAVTSGEVVIQEELEIVRADGSRGWISVDAAPVRDRDGAIVAAVSTFSDVTGRRRTAERQAFLTEAAAVLASSLDYEETVARVAQLAVPTMADWAAVDLVGPHGTVDHLSVAHADPSRVALVRQLRERFPPDPDNPVGPQAVVRSGRSAFVPEIPPDAYDRLPASQREAVLELGLWSYMCVPLVAGGDVLGAFSFASAESRRRFDEQDLALAESLATRAASAIQNARLYREVARFKAILDATRDAVLMFDPHAERVLYANQGAVELLGWDRDRLLSMASTELLAELDQRRLRALVAPLVDGRVASRTVTLALRASDGGTVPVEVLLQYVEPPGESGRLVAIARDIRDRVEAQARLQRLAEAEHARAAELNAVIRAIGEGVVVCDPQGRVTLANPAAEELFPEVGRGAYGDIVAGLVDPERRAPALGERGGPVELRMAGEPERWVELSTYPVVGHSEPAGASGGPETIALVRDVTAARQQQAVRDTFIGVLSHELRTPVTTIYAGSKVLARGDGGLDEELRRSVFDDIHVEAERLHRLVEDVIALTRFGEQDDSQVGKEPVLLQRILPVVVRSEESRWPGVTFDMDVPGGVPTVVADPTYVEQVVRNLLSNAAKYGGPGSRVHAIVEPADGEVRVRILDDGPGFPAEEADRLFDLFFRSPSTAAAASGAGIGLFVCARLIRAMGGRIWARPRDEGGAEFGFSLEVMDDDAPL